MKKLSLLFLFFSIEAIALTVTNISSLDFGTLVQGDPAKTIKPSNNEFNNARFNIVGESRRAFSIILPDETFLTHESNSSSKIRVYRFRSRPSGSGQLNKKGKKVLKVGARLQKISNGKRAGSYSGHFTVDVIY